MEKHLFYYTSHSQFSEPTNKPAVSYCELEDEVHYHPDPFNGHAYVDLGLPSGTLWATMNVGATSETDYGLYFAWGETQGYTASQVPSEKKFGCEGNNNDYTFTPNGIAYGDLTNYGIIKYNKIDNKVTLEETDDAVHVNMGGDWHMPSKAQYEELVNTNYVTNSWIIDYNGSGVNGRLFTSISNGNTMFIPAAGYYYNGNRVAGEDDDVCDNWSSSLYTDSINDAWHFGFDRRGAGANEHHDRCRGLSVRGVVGNITT